MAFSVAWRLCDHSSPGVRTILHSMYRPSSTERQNPIRETAWFTRLDPVAERKALEVGECFTRADPRERPPPSDDNPVGTKGNRPAGRNAQAGCRS